MKKSSLWFIQKNDKYQKNKDHILDWSSFFLSNFKKSCLHCSANMDFKFIWSPYLQSFWRCWHSTLTNSKVICDFGQPLVKKSWIDHVQIYLDLPVLLIFCQISQMLVPWQRGSIVVKLDWPHPISHPQSPPPVRCKDVRYIFITRQVIANFVWNFVAMAIGVCQG